ncbi:MAG: ABC transporter ATP-binding protein [Calditrichota bacterium]
MSVIRLQDVSKIYQDHGIPVKALQEINLEVQAGEFTTVVGPSGSGKSTLLNLIGGLDAPTTGKVWIENQELSALKPSDLINLRLHRIGFVFQAFNLIPVLTALENVEFILLLQGAAKSDRQRRARELLDAVGLGDQLHRRPTELSGGQQQRVAVARALASLPAFVLADEPTANLDSASADNLLSIMERLNHEQGMTFIFSTHDARVVARAHRVITLQDGRVFNDEPREPAA